MYSSYILNDKNHKQIMGRLYDYFSKKHNYQVGQGEEDLCYQMMKYQVDQNPAKRGAKPRDYVLQVNIKCIKELIKIISDKLKPVETPTQQHLSAQEELKPVNTLQANSDVASSFEQLMKNREPAKPTPKDLPAFGLSTETDNSAISSNFDKIAAQREAEQKRVEQQLIKDGQPPMVPTQATGVARPAHNDNSNVFGAPVDTPQPIEKADTQVSQNIENLNTAPMASGQALLLPKPKEFKNLVNNAYKYNNNFVKTYNLVIDSRDRNTVSYPDNYNYQIDLDYIYKDILSVELVSANVPKTQYLINSSNNKIYFTDNGSSELIATIPVGNYTSTTLATAVGTAMTTAGTNTFTVTDDTLTNTYTIAVNTGTYTLDFAGVSETYGSTTRIRYRDNSIGPIIGFAQTDLSGAITYTGANQYNFNGPTYILLHISDFDNLYGVHNNSITKSFAKITLDTDLNSYKFFKSQSDYITKKEFSPPMAKMAQLNIKFLNYDGSFYDFSGLDHCLYFKIKTLNQNQGYFLG